MLCFVSTLVYVVDADCPRLFCFAPVCVSPVLSYLLRRVRSTECHRFLSFRKRRACVGLVVSCWTDCNRFLSFRKRRACVGFVLLNVRWSFSHATITARPLRLRYAFGYLRIVFSRYDNGTHECHATGRVLIRHVGLGCQGGEVVLRSCCSPSLDVARFFPIGKRCFVSFALCSLGLACRHSCLTVTFGSLPFGVSCSV